MIVVTTIGIVPTLIVIVVREGSGTSWRIRKHPGALRLSGEQRGANQSLLWRWTTPKCIRVARAGPKCQRQTSLLPNRARLETYSQRETRLWYYPYYSFSNNIQIFWEFQKYYRFEIIEAELPSINQIFHKGVIQDVSIIKRIKLRCSVPNTSSSNLKNFALSEKM